MAIFLPTYDFSWDVVSSVDRVHGGMLGSLGLQFVLKEPVPAKRRMGWGWFWPRHASRPTFWIWQRDFDRAVEAMPPNLVHMTDRKVWLS